MRNSMISLTIAVTLAVVGASGCCCWWHRPNCAPNCPPGAACPPGPTGLPPVGAVPAVPPPAPVTFPQAMPPAPAPPAPEVRGLGPQAFLGDDSGWRPGDNQVRLSPPVAVNPNPPGNDTRLLPPEGPPAKLPPGPPAAATAPSVLPVGIAQFAFVKDKVANGLRPMLDDGLDWLRASGYHTVLHIRRPGEDDTADRKQVEKRGMIYRTLEVAPETLTRKTVEEFSRLVNNASSYPLFVYDRDGALAGALWYLHFRLTERDADEAARVRAANLGLREDREGTHRAMWLALQKLLSE
jgi:protein tyrosine phosphatase (PTP) superfamily phosphohydrolase (DUF442 family)